MKSFKHHYKANNRYVYRNGDGEVTLFLNKILLPFLERTIKLYKLNEEFKYFIRQFKQKHNLKKKKLEN